MYLFVSEGSAADLEADLLGWDEFHKGTLTVEPLAANHASLLELPKVGQVARLMLESLQQARGSTRTGHPRETTHRTPSGNTGGMCAEVSPTVACTPGSTQPRAACLCHCGHSRVIPKS
jgi:hypothetical protein